MHVPLQGAPRSFGRGRGRGARGARAPGGRGPAGAYSGYAAGYPQMPPMAYGFYYFPTAGRFSKVVFALVALASVASVMA
jgi:ribosomal protein L15